MITEYGTGQVELRKGTNGRSNPLVAQLTHAPFPEMARILQASAESITYDWVAACKEAMPQMERLTFDEVKDSTPQILHGIGDALASDDPALIHELIKLAPAQGLSRFKLQLDVVEVMQEDRLLRAITVQHVEAGLERQLNVPESAALHAAIDLMLQRSVIALVNEQKIQLRAAAATELKFLSFLAHDLNNNLNNVTLSLSVHATDLEKTGAFSEAVESLAHAQKAIADTVTGMRQMLDHERMRQSGNAQNLSSVNLHKVATMIALQFGRVASEKGIDFSVAVFPGTIVNSDGELITVVLQNLVSNALKYSQRGVVRIGSNLDSGRHVVWVSDQGPGIAPEKLGQIFRAFKRGEVHGQSGVGLGLAIASEGAKLLNAELTVQSEVGVGSTFRLTLPESAEAEQNL
jgi:signal transduction histidine kinase